MTLSPHLRNCPVGGFDNGVDLDVGVLQRRDGQHGLLGHEAVQVAYAHRNHAHAGRFRDLKRALLEPEHRE